MQKLSKKGNKKNIVKINLKNKKIILITAIIVLVATITAAITIPQIVTKIQAQKNTLLSYEIIKEVSEGDYKIVITVKSDDGLEYIKLPDGDTLKIMDQRTKVGIDYEIMEDTKYDFVIKQVGKDEVTESIFKEVQKIDGEYTLVNGVYSNKPDLTGFNADQTYYVLYDGDGNETIGDKVKNNGNNAPSNWYNYSESKWANIVVTDGTVSGGQITGATKTTYFTWIPRYEFKITSSQQAQPASARTEVRFLQGTSKDTDVGYQIPDAFWFDKDSNGTEDDGEQLTGYWVMKYTVGE